MLTVFNVIISLLTWVLANGANPVCNTPQCEVLGKFIKKSMNENADPCNNFYDYVCHNWNKENPRPKHEDLFNTERLLEYRVLGQLKKILENPNNTKVQNFEEVKILYRECMNLPVLEKVDAAKIKAIMAKVGNWVMFLPRTQELPRNLPPWWKIDNEYNKLTGESALFDIGLQYDQNKKEITVKLNPPLSPFGTLWRYLSWETPQEKEHYMTFLNKVIKRIAPGDTAPYQKQIDSDLQDVLQFRDEIRVITRLTSSDGIAYMTIKEFQQFYDKEKYSDQMATVNWLEKVRAIFKNPDNVNGKKIQETTILTVHKGYFELLYTLLEHTKKRTLVNHIHLYFAERHVNLDPEMEAELEQSVLHDPKSTGLVRFDPPRWQSCIESNNLRGAIGSMYVKTFFPNKDKEAVKILIEKAKLLLLNQINKSNWLNKETKHKLLLKIRLMKSVVGYTSWYNESLLEQPRDEVGYSIDSIKADAFFEENLNRISLSASYLQMPIYTPNVPYVIDYACTIAMIGHELYHGFDDNAIQNDKLRTFPLWSPDMSSQHDKQSRCFKNMYNTYRQESLLKHGINKEPNLPSTAVEDLADAMGLKLAYNGYLEKLNDQKGICPVLPGFEKIGCDKLFFIAFANNLCTTYGPDFEKRILLHDSHSLSPTRVNGAVANMKEFSAAFGCQAQDRMKNRKTCDIWQQ